MQCAHMYGIGTSFRETRVLFLLFVFLSKDKIDLEVSGGDLSQLAGGGASHVVCFFAVSKRANRIYPRPQAWRCGVTLTIGQPISTLHGFFFFLMPALPGKGAGLRRLPCYGCGVILGTTPVFHRVDFWENI